MNSNRVAVDLAKDVFQVCVVNTHNKAIDSHRLKRNKFMAFMTKLEPSPVFIEACYSAHYWGRTLSHMGHEVRLIPAQHVTPFVRGNKSDHNDALAIAEAACRPNLRFVPIKSQLQQEVMALHRIRQRYVKNRIQLSNQIRGILSDLGIVMGSGFYAFKKTLQKLPELDHVSGCLKSVLLEVADEFDIVSQKLSIVEQQIMNFATNNPSCQLLQTIPGIGYLNATALVASIDKGQAFSSAKELAVWLGLTPRQYGSGYVNRYGRITKRGDRYLRTMLIHGARAALRHARKRDDSLSRWINQLVARIGVPKATVAVAHKLARIAWVLLQKQEPYQKR